MNRLVSCSGAACLVVVLVLRGGVSQYARAQVTLQNGTIFGAVTDASGAAIVGAVVEATSPALQGTRTTATDSAGAYRIPDLPAGIYRIAYSMQGFETDVHSDFTLTAGFNARVDVALKVGSTQQTVSITGQAPVIDTSTTVTSTDIGRAVLDAVPANRNIYSAVYLAPGIRPAATPDIGGSYLGTLPSVGSYGYNGGPMMLMDGIMGTQTTSINGTGGPGDFPDYDSLEQFRVVSVAPDADINPAGPVMMTTMKSGGNQFHGDAHAVGEPHAFQLTNLPGTAPLGGSASNQLEYFWDTFADLGGKIIKDRLWFYGGYHLQRNSKAVFGYIGPNGGQGYSPDHQDNNEGKLTYQAAKSLRFIGDWTRSTQKGLQYFGSSSLAYPSNLIYFTVYWKYKDELVWTPSSKWLVDVLSGLMWQDYVYPSDCGCDVAGNPYTVNETTGITTGAYRNLSSQDAGTHRRSQVTGSVSYFPSGKHSFQWGSQLYVPQEDDKQSFSLPSGDYELETEIKSGTLVPLDLITWNYPFRAAGKQRAIGVYGKDIWRVSKKLTLNYGARFDNNLVYNNPETEPTGPFSLGGTYPYQSVENVSRVSPRVGAAYDLTGSGKTVIRGSYGIYNTPQFGAFDLSNYNRASFIQTTYNWAGDTCQVTPYTNCAPSAAFLTAITNSLANPSATTFGTPPSNIYITTTGGVLGIVNPNLRQPFFHTFSATFEHQLRQDLALRVLYVGNLEEDIFDLTSPNRPISDYTLAYNTVYPATDPVNAGKPITILYYPSSLASANQTEFVNRVGHPDFFNTIEVTLTERKTNKWSALTTVDFTKDHKWLPTTTPAIFASGASGAQPNAPYQTAFPLDLTWDYTFRSYFTYDLPYRVTFGINYQLLAGAPNYATDQFNSVPNLGTVYIPVNQWGTYRAPAQNVMNLRFGRIFPIKEHDTLEFTVELFNALDVAPGTTVNYINGAVGTTKQFGYTSVYMAPMIGRIGAFFKF